MQFKRTYEHGAEPDSAWQSRAACRSADPELFFGPEAERVLAKRAREAAAVAVCSRCLVTAQCRAWADETFTPYGVWGGLPEARAAVQRGHFTPNRCPRTGKSLAPGASR